MIFGLPQVSSEVADPPHASTLITDEIERDDLERRVREGEGEAAAAVSRARHAPN